MCVKPLIISPRFYDKFAAFHEAYEHAQHFLTMNSIKLPANVFLKPRNKRKEWATHGWYSFRTTDLYVNIEKSAKPSKQVKLNWSFPGTPNEDFTAPGLLAHEIGHHVHNQLISDNANKAFLKRLRQIKRSEPGVSSYESCSYEMFAESVRLFMLNPNLLREGRPNRWKFLTNELGLKPSHDLDWRQVIIHASADIVSETESWLLAKR